MEVLNEFLKTKGIYSLVMILFFLGVYGMGRRTETLVQQAC